MIEKTVEIPSIFLIGYRGTGKTTLARLVGERLGWPWLDLDQIIEERQGCSISQIFASEGEAGFRATEAACLEELCRPGGQVVATGGGIVLSEANRRLMADRGLVVWLVAEPRVLLRRLEADPTTAARRPALSMGGLAEIEDLLAKREPLYRQCADIIVETNERRPEELAGEIVSRVRTHRRLEPNPAN